MNGRGCAEICVTVDVVHHLWLRCNCDLALGCVGFDQGDAESNLRTTNYAGAILVLEPYKLVLRRLDVEG